MGRVIAAGLLAGLVLNVGEAVLHGVIFAAQTAETMKQLGHDIAGSGANTAQLVLITFVQGVLGMVLYSDLTARWGAGAGTAARVGLILWVLSAVYSAVYLGSGFAGLFPGSLVWGPVAYELVLYPVAMMAGRMALRDRTAATMPA